MNLAKKINLHYTTIQGSFGIGFGALMSFGAVLMLSRGLSNSALGVVTCIAQLLPMVLQPAVTSFAARREGMTTRKMLMLLTLPILVMAVVMLLAPQSLGVIIAGYMLIFLMVNLITPYHNVLMVDFLTRGVEVNYGLGRGVGSGTFALATLVLGFVLEGRDSVLIVPVIGGAMLLQLLCVAAFRYPLPAVETVEEQREAVGRMAILRSRRDFVLLLGAVALLLGVHNVTNVYMVHVIDRVGGAESLMGIILGVSAVTELISMPLFPKLQRKFGITALLRFAAAFFVVRLVLLLLAPSGEFLYLAAVAQFASSGILLPAIVYYVAQALTPEQQTNGQGMIHLAGYCLGPALITLGVGAVVDGSGIQAALGVMIALAAVGTVLMAAATRKRGESCL